MARMTRGDTAARISAYRTHERERQSSGRFAPGTLATMVAYAVVVLLIATVLVQQLARRDAWTLADFARGTLAFVMLMLAGWAFSNAVAQR